VGGELRQPFGQLRVDRARQVKQDQQLVGNEPWAGLGAELAEGPVTTTKVVRRDRGGVMGELDQGVAELVCVGEGEPVAIRSGSNSPKALSEEPVPIGSKMR
jgi:hypothetical protein